ncbi:binding partner of ACD11 1-like isoform X1 [Apium graveolens]|uniref:binding partner of ACD11 1-like isoform X1 n=2 Tax=Apium graveolens TaxID=4045 RepID=UPI003D7AD4CF
MSVKSVSVNNVSLTASENDIREFFSFSGDIECIDLQSDTQRSQMAYVTFKNPQGAEKALLLSGGTIIDQSVTIALAPDYNLPPTAAAAPVEKENRNVRGTPAAVEKAEDVVSGMLARGFTLGKDAAEKAKSIDQKHQFTSSASAKVAAFDKKIGLSRKFSQGATIMNDKVKAMDQKLQVSAKTKTAAGAAQQTVSSAGSAIMKNRYFMTGTSWVVGAFSRVKKTAAEVRQKTMEKMAKQEGRKVADGSGQVHNSGSADGASMADGSDQAPGSGSANGASVEDGSGQVPGTGSANDASVADGSVQVSDTGSINGAPVADGSGQVASTGSTNGASVADGSREVSSTGSTNGVTVADGDGQVPNTGSANSASVADGSRLVSDTGSGNAASVTDGSGQLSSTSSTTGASESLSRHGNLNSS